MAGFLRFSILCYVNLVNSIHINNNTGTGRLPGGGAGLRDDGFQPFALAGRRLTSNF